MIVLYDLETKRPVAPKDPTHRIEGIEYAANWTDFQNMGISCWGAAVFYRGEWSYHASTRINELGALFLTAEIVVGFNNHSFDRLLLKAQPKPFMVGDENDLLFLIRRATGKFYEKGFGLKNLAKLNGFESPLEESALAPVHYQRGQVHKAMHQVTEDVAMLAHLFRLAFYEGGIETPLGKVVLEQEWLVNTR